MAKWVLYFALVLLAINLADAQQPFQVTTVETPTLTIIYPKIPYYKVGENISLHFHVYNSTGFLVTNATTTCTFHLFNSTGDHVVAKRNLDFNTADTDFNFVLNKTFTKVPVVYSYLIHCNNSEAGFVSATFTIARGKLMDETVGSMPLVIMVLLPMILGVFFLVASISLSNEEHVAMKIGFLLMSFFTFFMSVYIGMQTIIKYYDFAEMQIAVTWVMWLIGSWFFVVISYFFVYLIIIAIHTAADRRDKRLNY